jgi:hypothetical protein
VTVKVAVFLAAAAADRVFMGAVAAAMMLCMAEAAVDLRSHRT